MIFGYLIGFIGLAVFGWSRRKRWMVIAFGSLPAAAILYFLAGIGIAGALRQGRFYSIPFGGFSVGGSDAALFGSLAFWWLFWSGLLAYLTRNFRASQR
jgi:hypothetical protein